MYGGNGGGTKCITVYPALWLLESTYPSCLVKSLLGQHNKLLVWRQPNVLRPGSKTWWETAQFNTMFRLRTLAVAFELELHARCAHQISKISQNWAQRALLSDLNSPLTFSHFLGAVAFEITLRKHLSVSAWCSLYKTTSRSIKTLAAAFDLWRQIRLLDLLETWMKPQ